MAEFPRNDKLIAIAVSAAESATGVLDRACRSARGELSKEFGRVLAETGAGRALAEAFHGLSSRTDQGALVRFVDGMMVAVERVQWSPIVILRPISLRIVKGKRDVWKIVR